MYVLASNLCEKGQVFVLVTKKYSRSHRAAAVFSNAAGATIRDNLSSPRIEVLENEVVNRDAGHTHIDKVHCI